MDYYNDSAVLDRLLEIKAANKRRASDLFIRDSTASVWTRRPCSTSRSSACMSTSASR